MNIINEIKATMLKIDFPSFALGVIIGAWLVAIGVTIALGD